MRIGSVVLIASLSWSGCASVSGSKDQFYVCSYDVAWDAAVLSVKDRPVQVADKGKGVIETNWVEVEGAERTYGIFDREGFGNRERTRMSIAVKRLNDVVSVSVLETRQRWHLKGGVGQQSTRWWPIDPSEEAEASVTDRIRKTINEKGCVTT